jgi:hypothetical protein
VDEERAKAKPFRSPTLQPRLNATDGSVRDFQIPTPFSIIMTTQPQTSRRRFLTSGGTAIASAALAAGKSMGNCMATGHAAGLAAALCAQRNCQPRELEVSEATRPQVESYDFNPSGGVA